MCWRASRPQLKRDPLGSATPHGNEASPRFPLALLWPAPIASRGHGGRAGPHRAQPLAVSSTASAPGALPNKRLKLAGGGRSKGSGVLRAAPPDLSLSCTPPCGHV